MDEEIKSCIHFLSFFGQRNQKITSFFHDFKSGRMDEEIKNCIHFLSFLTKISVKKPLALGKGLFFILYYTITNEIGQYKINRRYPDSFGWRRLCYFFRIL